MQDPSDSSKGALQRTAAKRALAALADRAARALADETEGEFLRVEEGARRAALSAIARHAPTSMALTLAAGDKGVWQAAVNGTALPPAAAAIQQRGNLLVVLHDPACPGEDLVATLDALDARAANARKRLVYYLCTPELRTRLVARGFSSFHMGAEAIVDLAALTLEAPEHANLRRALRHAAGQGIELRVIEPPISAETLRDVVAVNDRWLDAKGVREFQFSQGYVGADYLRSMPLCEARVGGTLVGYCNILCPHVPLGLDRAPAPGEGSSEVMVDLMRSGRGVSWSLAQAIWLTAMVWARDKGYARFNMGMAPLAGVGEQPDATFTERLARRFAAAGGGPIEQGLHHFKSLFKPMWEPRYLCWRGRAWLPWVFWQTTSMVLAMSSADRERIAAGRASAL